MKFLFFWFLISLLANRLQYHAVKKRTVWNGYLTIDGTLDKSLPAPLVYRVLMPWLVVPCERLGLSRENSYALWKVVFLWIGLVSIHAAWGFWVALIFVVLSEATQIFDTWCYAPEAIGVSAAMLGNPALAFIAVIIHGLSRETVFILPLIYYLRTGDGLTALLLLGVACAVTILLIRVQGSHDRYTNRQIPGEYRRNLARYKNTWIAGTITEVERNWRWIVEAKNYKFKGEPALYNSVYMHMIVIVFALWGATMTGAVGWAVPLMACLGFWPVISSEIRTNTWLYPWAALGLFSLIGG